MHLPTTLAPLPPRARSPPPPPCPAGDCKFNFTTACDTCTNRVDYQGVCSLKSRTMLRIDRPEINPARVGQPQCRGYAGNKLSFDPAAGPGLFLCPIGSCCPCHEVRSRLW